MGQFVVIGENFLRTLLGAVGDELRKSRGPYNLVTNADVDYEMDELAAWLVKKYFGQKYEVLENKD